MKYLTSLLLTWAVAVSLVAAQDKKPVEVLVFKGVDNSRNPLFPQENGVVTADECINFDLSMTIGTLNKARGYASVVNILATDSIRGLFGYRTNDGEARMFTVYGGGSGWDILKHSDTFSYTQNTAAISIVIDGLYLYRNTTPSWAAWDDIVIYANGKGYPWRWANEGWRPLIPPNPGIFSVSPNAYNDGTDWYLHGNYYYGIRSAEPCSSGANLSYTIIGTASEMVRVDSGSTYLHFLPEISTTNICSPSATVFQVCRTRAGAPQYDSMFLVDSFAFTNSYAGRAGYTIRDTVPDDSLGAASGTYPYIGKLDTTIHTADTTSDTFYCLGQPQWMGTLISASGGEGPGAQIDTGEIDYHRYGMCWFDSATGTISPMGPVLKVPVIKGAAATPFDSVVQLALPRVPQAIQNYWRIIYRAREYTDTIRVPDSSWDDDLTPPEYLNVGGGKQNIQKPYCPPGMYLVQVGRQWQCKKGSWSYFSANEEHPVVGGFYPVDTIKSSLTTTLDDTLSYITLEARLGAYSGVIPAGNFDNPVIYKNRLFMTEGSNVYYTEPGQIAVFESYFPVNLDDGDENTCLHVASEDLLIFKNRSVHKAEWLGSGYGSYEYISGLGCIASASVVDVPGGGYGFLSEKGYYLFTTHLQSQYKESGGNLPNISGPIQNHLDAYDMDDLRECHAWWTPDYKNLCLSFPTLDTTWVYSTNGMGWSAWTFAFRQTTRYDTTYQTYLRPSNNVLGVINKSDSVYRYGATTLFAGDSITASYKTLPMFKNYRRSQIRKVGLWMESDTTCDISVILFNRDGTQVDTVIMSTSNIYQPYEFDGEDASGWWQILLKTIVDSVSIEGLDLWPEWVEDPTGK